jgi:hypothetical protein
MNAFRQTLNLVIFSLIFAVVPATVGAQEGFEKIAPVVAGGDELYNQPQLWVMEVQFKPMRMIWVELKDAATGEMKKEPIYYMCYRAINRPIATRIDTKTKPQNELDAAALPPYLVPAIDLVAKNGEEIKVYSDQIIPEAQKAINAFEKREYMNSVQLVQPIPPATDGEMDDSNTVYGVAMFRGLDLDMERFTIMFRGFSNGHKSVEGSDGTPLTERKTLKQEFWRPGDRFDPELFGNEVRFVGEPTWFYRPE